MQRSVFNLPFQITIYHPIMNNKSNNVASTVLLLYNDTPGVVLKEEQPYIAQFPQDIIN